MTFSRQKLTEADLATLTNPALAELAGLYRVDSDTGGSILGRNGYKSDYSGIVFPNFLPGEPDPRENRIRRDRPDFEIGTNGKPKEVGKYLGPVGRPPTLYFVRGTNPLWLKDTTLPVVVLEGEKKALAGWYIGWHGLGDTAEHPRFLPIAITGAWNFRGKVGKAEGPDGGSLDLKGLLPDWFRCSWRNRRVSILLDADARTNESVAAARKSLAFELRKLGAVVSVIDMPDAGVKGFDDLVREWGNDRALAFLTEAFELEGETQGFALTELGNAERLIRDCAGQARYCHAFAAWFVWDGVRFRLDDNGEMERRAKKMVRSIPLEAAAASQRAAKLRTDSTVAGLSEQQREKLMELAKKADGYAQQISKWALQSESSARIKSTLQLAQSEEGVPVSPHELDADPWQLNVRNGVIDLRTGALLPHSPERLITKLAPVTYDAAAKCSRFEQFLNNVFPGEYQDIIPFLKKFIGYLLTGVTREEVMAMLWGSGRNGKGTLIKLIDAMLGDYAGTADPSSFSPKRDDAIREDIAALAGKRFISAQETREGGALAESVIKSLTGGDKVRARRLHENGFEFVPSFKLWLSTNHKPEIRGTDAGIWSRIRLIPFTVSFEGREDKSLKDDLLNELPGVLNWAIEGCLEWQRDGLGVPESVARANQEYKTESDQVQRFLDDRCVQEKGALARCKETYMAYQIWHEESGEKNKLSLAAFGNRMKAKGFTKKKKEAGKSYEGIRFQSSEEAETRE